MFYVLEKMVGVSSGCIAAGAYSYNIEMFMPLIFHAKVAAQKNRGCRWSSALEANLFTENTVGGLVSGGLPFRR
eukprot:1194666-Prorocentrum_minimum.AAC.2